NGRCSARRTGMRAACASTSSSPSSATAASWGRGWTRSCASGARNRAPSAWQRSTGEHFRSSCATASRASSPRSSNESPSFAGVELHPRNVAVHPVLEELAAVGSDPAGGVEQPLLHLDEALGLAERRHVEVGERVPQVLLRD